MAAAVFALIFAAKIDPNALSARVAARYSALTTNALAIELRAVVNGRPAGAFKTRLEAGAANRYFYHHGLDAVEFTTMPPVTIIGDGQTVYRDDGRVDGVIDEGAAIFSQREVQRAMKLLHERFATLDGPAMRAPVVKGEKFHGRRCAVIRIKGDPNELAESWDDVPRSHYTRVLRERPEA